MIVRASAPACALDVQLAINFKMKISKKEINDDRGDGSSSGENFHDGDYELFHRGVGPRMTVYCHNVVSAKPTEFITLVNCGETNYSHAPSGGSCYGDDVRTKFSKVRISPWTLIVKTDDYTFAETTGGPLTQSYWNGERIVTLDRVPYATARDSLGNWWPSDHFEATLDDLAAVGDWPQLPDGRGGNAMIDLRGTTFGINDIFCSMGCAAGGRLAFNQKFTEQHLHIAGGGYAGRVAPQKDRTCDESADGGNYDDEGNNGGWCLQLKIITDKEEKKIDVLHSPTSWIAIGVLPVDAEDK